LYWQEVCHERKESLFHFCRFGGFGFCVLSAPSRRGKRWHRSWHPDVSSTPLPVLLSLSISISRVCGSGAVLCGPGAVLRGPGASVLPTSPGICAAGSRICATQPGLYAASNVRATATGGPADISNSAPISEPGSAAGVSAAACADIYAPAARRELMV